MAPRHSILFMVMRRMRAPTIVLIAVYAISVLGMSLVPGVDAEGRPAPPLSVFHAFYFVSFTATTIGFGEIPTAFGNAQRMWVTVTIYLSVIGWSYMIVSLLALAQDRAFRLALAANRFSWQVRRISEPFYLICGCGETGELVLHALDRLGVRCVVVEIDEERVNELELEDLRADTPTLLGDVRTPRTLALAGLRSRWCRGALALTDDDEANLAVAASARLLNPNLQVIARAQQLKTAANMASFGVRRVVNPFEAFADYLRLAMREPSCYRLLDWLTALPASSLRKERPPPRGDWVICGHGRFGTAVARRLKDERIGLKIVDPDPAAAKDERVIRGVGTEAAVLREAGIADAEGLVAATDSDVANLAIAVTAREINPDVFLVVRQNAEGSERLFAAIEPDVVMDSSEIIAHECIAVIMSPLLEGFLDVVRGERDAWASALIRRLETTLGDDAPAPWSVRIDRASAPALFAAASARDSQVTLGDILRDPLDRTRALACVPLMLRRADGSTVVLPGPDEALKPMHALLLASSPGVRARVEMTITNANELEYVCTGVDRRTGWIWQAISNRRRKPAAGAGPTETT
ncbi:MAG TPA: potassium channel family protein [Burkholderiaceae bacterium]